ncbi:hypothetical protein A3K93_08920 [Acinetobacter sp. NCu2D-2]|uniref:GNAT family N-acetyltransferase n=1 Tax=Acinetobacter sp. NCu2D-2 TaxID=1608473 RepID=UPI0007CDB522|nr:GNAT family N-acetyltransferase [Acinetobacter sp. NCu2D-2]ANF82304.1 hypothetical protein A3K93_08920 [Acinetobacter sp. NCu2D-2]
MIREGKVQDIPQIIDVIQDSIRSCVEDHHRHENIIQPWLERYTDAQLISEMLYNDCWVYLIHDKVVGFIMVTDQGEIKMHFVATHAQKMGIGSALYDYMLQQMSNKNVHKIEVKSTLSSLDYYLHLGFQNYGPSGLEESQKLYKYLF